jgi:hypothetical protein
MDLNEHRPTPNHHGAGRCLSPLCDVSRWASGIPFAGITRSSRSLTRSREFEQEITHEVIDRIYARRRAL